MLRSLVVITAVALAGCSAKAPAKEKDRPAVTPSTPAADAATPAPVADPCADIRARFTAALATRTDTCTTAADCGCYNPVGGPDQGCGGVTDALTVPKLAPIEAEFHAASCSWTHNCAPWACAPKCDRGRCTP